MFDLWNFFLQLHRQRTSGFGVNPIEAANLESWSRLVDFPVSPAQALVLLDLDELFRTTEYWRGRKGEFLGGEDSSRRQLLSTSGENPTPQDVARVMDSFGARAGIVVDRSGRRHQKKETTG